MNRRRAARHSRRLQVQFWQPGEEVRRGVTTNVSASGMHIATTEPLPPTARLRIEVVHGSAGFLVEGVVAHRRSVHPELNRVAISGMGVRLLTPDELMGELFPLSAAAGAPGAATDTAATSRPARAATRESTARATTDSTITDTGSFLESSASFSVRFASAKDFLQTYQRDICNGGLFVATSRPGQLQEIVQIEIHPPLGAGDPVIADARVVQRFVPQSGNGAILVGMGVELLELPLLLMRLRPLVDRLKQRA